jgi:hypothetical protein
MVSGFLSVFIQIVLGIIIVVVIYKLSLWMLHQDELIMDDRWGLNMDKRDVTIVDGYAMTGMAANRVWNTINPYASNYAAIMRSYNRMGGAQFSYSFWMNLSDVSPENVAGRTILMRGDNRKYVFEKQVDQPSYAVGNPEGVQPVRSRLHDVMIKCPRIMFGQTYDSFMVEFNTMHNIDEKVSFAPTASSDNTLRHNALKLGQGKWVLYTFTFQDNTSINDFEDGIVIRMYVNDLLYNTAFVKSALRQNNGNFYLLPDAGGGSIRNAKIGHVKYFNYALGHAQINDLYNTGPPKYFARDLMGREGSGDPLYLSEYNKLDIYNT